jgi:atypical dual specificity phosphatase
MDWVTDEIAIGDQRDAQDSDLLRREKVGSILGLVPTLLGREPGELGVRHIEVVPLIDGHGNRFDDFLQAVSTLGRLLAEAPPVLVHCRAGMGRSPVVVAAHLMRTRSLSADEALALVAARRRISILVDMRALLVQLQETITPGQAGD